MLRDPAQTAQTSRGPDISGGDQAGARSTGGQAQAGAGGAGGQAGPLL